MILLSKSYTISFLSLSLLPSSYTQHFASSLASLFREGNRTTNADMDRMAFTSITNGISSIKLFGNICTGAVVSVVGQPTFSTMSKYWSSRSDIFSISFNTHRQLCNFECTYNSIMHATVWISNKDDDNHSQQYSTNTKWTAIAQLDASVSISPWLVRKFVVAPYCWKFGLLIQYKMDSEYWNVQRKHHIFFLSYSSQRLHAHFCVESIKWLRRCLSWFIWTWRENRIKTWRISGWQKLDSDQMEMACPCSWQKTRIVSSIFS